MGNRLSSGTETGRRRWVQGPRPSSRVPVSLFLIPHAGAGPSSLRGLARQFPTQIGVSLVQLPGREERLLEAPFKRVDTAVTALAHVLAPAITTPFALFGHSLGALIAFELARELRGAYDIEPAYLFISAHPGPQVPRLHRQIYRLPDAAFIDALTELNGMPQSVLEQPDLMALLLPTLRADFEMYETYSFKPSRPLACPISGFGGWRDTNILRSDLAAWREQTTKSFKLRMLPGDHFFLHEERAAIVRAVWQDFVEAAILPQ